MCLVATRRRRKSETSHSSEVINSCVTARVARPAETLMDLVTFCQDSDFPFVSFPQARVLSDSWMLANHSHSRFWSSLSLFFFLFEHAHYCRQDVSVGVSADSSLLTAKKGPGDSSQLCNFICICIKIWSHCLYQPCGKSNSSAFFFQLGSPSPSLLLVSAANELITQ